MIEIVLYSLSFTAIIIGVAAFIYKIYPPLKSDPKLNTYGILLSSFNIFMLAFLDGSKYNQYMPIFNIYYNLFDYTIIWFLLSSFWYIVITDFLLWLQHYVFHSKILYTWFHYVHHKFTYPTSWDFAAVHPIEMLSIYMVYHALTIFFPVYIGTIYLYGLTANLLGILYHGQGFKFFEKYLPCINVDIEFHNIHHIMHSKNYGIGIFTALWDRLFSTYSQVNMHSEKNKMS